MKQYQISNGVVYNGDCRDVIKNLDQKIDLVSTSPPYNVGIEYDNHDENVF